MKDDSKIDTYVGLGTLSFKAFSNNIYKKASSVEQLSSLLTVSYYFLLEVTTQEVP